MIRFPLFYFGSCVAECLVDDDFDWLRAYTLMPRMSKRFRSLRLSVSASIAMLREDKPHREKISPVISLNRNYFLLVSHVVISDDLQRLLQDHFTYDLDVFKHYNSLLGRISYESPNLCDCRRSNLRHLTPNLVPPVDESLV